MIQALSDEPVVKYVIKRDGSRQEVDINKIRRRMLCHSYGLNETFINYEVVVNKVFSGIYSGKSPPINKMPPLSHHALLISLLGVTTSELDNLTAETCAYMNIVHPDYSKLAARIAVSNLHKRTSSDFLEVSKKLKNF